MISDFIAKYALFLATLERRAKRDFLGATLFFVEKSKIFQQKNNVAPIDLLNRRLLSEAKNSP